MDYIVWSDALSVDNEEIDNQHIKLIEIINKMHEANIHKKGHDTILEILDSLKDYTQYHFSFEEQLLKEKNYPKVQHHHDVHENLKKQLDDYIDRIKHKKWGTSWKINTFLEDWLIVHIMKEDKQCIDYLKKS